jgi:hypothetical protein
LTNWKDELLWDGDPRGVYTPKEGYVQLSVDLQQREKFGGGSNSRNNATQQKEKIWFGQY